MSGLSADAFFSDDRISQAKSLILEALQEHQSRLTAVKPASAALAVSYTDLLDRFEASRGSKLWFPYVASGVGHGALVELKDGSVKYDLINGIGVHMGHSIPGIIEASVDGAIQDTVMQGNLQQNQRGLDILEILRAESGLDHGYLTSSGVMACENGLKMVFQKQFPRQRVLAFRKCFMGRTLAVAQITDKAAYRDGLPPTLNVDYVPFFDANDPEKSTEKALNVIQMHIDRYPEQHAVMCMELIQGEGGYFAGDTAFFKAIIAKLKENGIAVMVDEVQSFGRTENMFAFQTFGLEGLVDVVTIGKNTQVCATLFTSEFKPRPGLVSQTFTSSTTALEASYYILKTLRDDHYFGINGKINRLHDYMVGHLKRLSQAHPDLIAGPFGIGAMIAFTPLKGERDKVLAFIKALFEAGVIGFVAGQNPTRARFILPVFSLTESDIDAIVDILEATLIAHA